MNTVEMPTESVLSREMVALAINYFFRKYLSKAVLPDQKKIGENVGLLGRVRYEYEHEGVAFVARVGKVSRKERDVPAVFFERVTSGESIPFAYKTKFLFLSPDRLHQKYVRLAG